MTKSVVRLTQSKDEGGERMRSEDEIKMLRSGHGYFTKQSMVDALEAEGITMSKATYTEREKGRVAFKASEIKALAKIFNMSMDEAVSFFA